MSAAQSDASTLVVAIDGPSGSGKSTVSREVAKALHLRYLDTGAMYRALTWWVLDNGVDPADADGVLKAADSFTLEISSDPEHQAVSAGGHDVTTAIRSAEVTAAVSAVSAIPGVRRRLVADQQAIIGAGGIVVEGRDIGTTVCPDAPVKIFLTAAADARAGRRARELNEATDLATVQADLARRDRIDSSRVASPLVEAADAVEVDTTALDVRQVISAVLALVRERTGIIADAADVTPAGEGRR
jgi:cytidylate kinase